MKQPMDIKINQLPSRTWNWLHMNESTVEQVSIDGENTCKIFCPVEITRKKQIESQTLFSDIKTGMGADMDRLAEDARISANVFEIKNNTQMTEPLRMEFHYVNGDKQMNETDLHTLEGSTATVVMDYTSEPKAEGLGAILTRILAEKDAHLNLIQIVRVGAEFDCMNDIGIECKDHAEVQVFHVILGGRKVWQGCRAELTGKESCFQCEIGYLAEKEMQLDLNYLICHLGRQSTCEINSSGVLKDQAKKLFRGTIDFRKGCVGAKGKEKEDVLLLDDAVENKTIPVILCAEEDVEGNHGATIGQLDEELLFYLQSRGINEKAVYEMLAKARIDAVCRKIPDMQIRKEMEKKLGGGETDEQ